MKVRKYEVRRDAVCLVPYRGDPLEVPFSRMQPRPTRSNPIAWIGWDPGVGRHGPVYRLKDGVVRLLDPTRGGSLDALVRALGRLGVRLELKAA